MDKGIMGKIRYFSVVFGELGEMLIFISPLTLLPLLVALLFEEWELFLPLATVPFLFLQAACFSTVSRGMRGRSGFLQLSVPLPLSGSLLPLSPASRS